jgi:predicted metallo-beta-lactamase superfamily hydrolase
VLLRAGGQVGERVLVTDPGVALGEHRFDLPPHPGRWAVRSPARRVGESPCLHRDS